MQQRREDALADGRRWRSPTSRRTGCSSIVSMTRSTIEREAAEQQQIDGQDHERAPAAHPAAELLDADRGDASDGAGERAEARACRSGRRGGRSRSSSRSYAAATGSRSGDVTWRNSSSRSLAARAKLTTGMPGRHRRRQQPGRRLVVAAEPELDRAVLEHHGGGDVGVGREPLAGGFERLALERAPAPAAPPRSGAASRCRRPGPGPAPGRDRRSRRSCTAPRAREGCGC